MDNKFVLVHFSDIYLTVCEGAYAAGDQQPFGNGVAAAPVQGVTVQQGDNVIQSLPHISLC